MDEIFFIVYPDGIQKKGEKPLTTLTKFTKKYLRNFTAIHVLPFHPYSSDRGFAVVDFKAVHKKFGSWKNLQTLSKTHKLMYDAVINHTSSENMWFQKALKGSKTYQNFFIHFDKKVDTSNVFRPRDKPLLHKYKKMYYWTTFSKDEVDLNLRNPRVFEEIMEIINFYVSHGAKYLRLDAIAYIFDDPSKKTIDRKEPHIFIQKIKKLLPKDVKLVSEVNLEEKVIDKYRKQTLVYNFPLPALVYYSVLTGNVNPLKKFLSTHQQNSLNFLASHDGIGLAPVRDFLTKTQIDKLVEDVEKKGFHVSYGRGPYELNINYFDALGDEQAFLLAHALLISLKGIPAIYYHSLFGSHGKKRWNKKNPRSVNRENLNYTTLVKELETDCVRKRVFTEVNNLLKFRKSHKEFLPKNKQTVKVKGSLLEVQRGKMRCFFNFSSQPLKIRPIFDVFTKKKVSELKPYGYIFDYRYI